MSIIEELYEQKFLRDIDVHFAKNICETFDAWDYEALFAILFNSTSGGHTSLNINNLSPLPYYEDNQFEIDSAVNMSRVKELIKLNIIAKAPATSAPFVLEGERLFLKVFYDDEKEISEFIKSRSVRSKPSDKLLLLLDKYFNEDSMQKAAALLASVSDFCVITGGPGTGKTTTVFNILAIQQELSDTPLKIAIAAPTGKAAARLSESIKLKKEGTALSEVTTQIPDKASTLHRLLNINSRKSKYSTDNRIDYDVIVVDEASMVDVQMMATLLRSIKDGCKLILLGDKDQLDSVQPGAVLGDICEISPVEIFSEQTAKYIQLASGEEIVDSGDKLSDLTIELDKSHRYDDTKGIGLLAKSCRMGDADSVINILKNDPTNTVELIELKDDFESIVSKLTLDHYKDYTSAGSYGEIIKRFDRTRILSALKKQTGGVEQINEIAYKTLLNSGLRDNTKAFFDGMPLMITENDYTMNLFNGETGIVLKKDDAMRGIFASDKGIRDISTSRIPAHTPAFAMTVHKSQGSEFDHVVFVLPDIDSQIMKRELFYTAVTRAKSKLTVISSERAIRRCFSKPER